jgi:hypothetical protein
MTALDIDAKGNLVIENLALCVKAAAEGGSSVSDADLGALVRILLRLSSRGEPAAAAPEPKPEAAPAPQPDKPATKPNGHGERKSTSTFRHKLSYDDKVRIKQRYDADMEKRRAAGFATASRGFVASLATEFGVTDKSIYNVLKGE